jgi:hypothetical protein
LIKEPFDKELHDIPLQFRAIDMKTATQDSNLQQIPINLTGSQTGLRITQRRDENAIRKPSAFLKSPPSAVNDPKSQLRMSRTDIIRAVFKYPFRTPDIALGVIRSNSSPSPFRSLRKTVDEAREVRKWKVYRSGTRNDE